MSAFEVLADVEPTDVESAQDPKRTSCSAKRALAPVGGNPPHEKRAEHCGQGDKCDEQR
jgi:hypothetical protein